MDVQDLNDDDGELRTQLLPTMLGYWKHLLPVDETKEAFGENARELRDTSLSQANSAMEEERQRTIPAAQTVIVPPSNATDALPGHTSTPAIYTNAQDVQSSFIVDQLLATTPSDSPLRPPTPYSTPAERWQAERRRGKQRVLLPSLMESEELEEDGND